jgi:aspartate-semialdehyde dehydrogenase
MRIGIVGATGLVGSKMIEVLHERKVPFDELVMIASEKSAGKIIEFGNKKYKVISTSDALKQKFDYALFSAGSTVSLDLAPKFEANGTIVIDNSAAWRMYDDIKLVVPEVNGHVLTKNDRIIANPNCSTIPLVLVLNPLHKIYNILRVVVSTYQSVSGTGIKGIKQLENETKGLETEMAYPYQIHRNLIPQGGQFFKDGYTSEEVKLVSETRKIMGDQNIMISPTVVRVPVICCHSESVNIEFEKPFIISDVITMLAHSPAVVVEDDATINLYPMPLYCEGKDEAYVGRLRVDQSQPNSLNMWIVSDNLRLGAATNAVKILEYIISHLNN